jgi:hypothetical protein
MDQELELVDLLDPDLDRGRLTSARRRAGLFGVDLATLGAAGVDDRPRLPWVTGTDEALGRLYVLEGSTLGGTFIDRHLAGLPGLRGVRLHVFSLRRGDRCHVARLPARDPRPRGPGRGPDTMLAAATSAFRFLGEWCRAPLAAA